jgi:hypothetical protein
MPLMIIWITFWPFALFRGNLEYVVAIRLNIPILVYYIKKNLATLGLGGKTSLASVSQNTLPLRTHM